MTKIRLHITTLMNLSNVQWKIKPKKTIYIILCKTFKTQQVKNNLLFRYAHICAQIIYKHVFVYIQPKVVIGYKYG